MRRGAKLEMVVRESTLDSATRGTHESILTKKRHDSWRLASGESLC